MKRILFVIIICYSVSLITSAQEYLGAHTSNYLPFVGLTNQPAQLVRSDAKWNINIIGVNAAFINDQNFADSDFLDFMDQKGHADLKYFLATEQSLVFAKGRMTIPSISYKLNEKHAFGFMTSVRADGIYNSSNDDFLKLFSDIGNPQALKDIKDEYFKSLVNSWVEYSLTWSTVLLSNGNDLLTGGLSLKFLNSSGSGYLEMDGIDVKFEEDRLAHFNMQFSYGFNKSFTKTADGGDIIERSGDYGLGFDFGLSYSYQPEHYKDVKGAPYKYKIGFVLADVGSITNRQTDEQASYRVSMKDVPYSRFIGVESLDALKDSIVKSVDFNEVNKESFKTNLPLSLMLDLDYTIKPKLFVNASVICRPSYSTATVDFSQTLWRTALTLRYEDEKWGVFLPVTKSSVLGWNAGIAARYKQFFIGSNTFVGNLFGSHNGQANAYFGISIPIGSLE